MNLAALATEFLERQGLVSSTVRSYESTMIPLLQQYGRVVD
jgi:integrase/recombinase XerD